MTQQNEMEALKFCLTCGNQADASLELCPVDGAKLVAEAPLQSIGTLLAGRYVIEAQVGQGGWASVYRAQDKETNQKVALKLLHGYLAEPERIARFQREAQSLVKVSHKNICNIFDFGLSEDGQPYIGMELVEGMTLTDKINKGRLDAPSAVAIASQICDALQEAHRVGVIHRDIKPDNIHVMKDGTVKVLDFGLAKSPSDINRKKLTKTGQTMGTPRYMSPEQCQGLQLGPPSDIYSLAVTAFEMLTGNAPFRASNQFDVMVLHVSQEAPSLSKMCPEEQFPPALERSIRKALKKNPGHRYQNAADFKQSLEASLLDSKSPQGFWARYFPR